MTIIRSPFFYLISALLVGGLFVFLAIVTGVVLFFFVGMGLVGVIAVISQILRRR